MNFTNFPKVFSETVDMKIIFFGGSSPVVSLVKRPSLVIHSFNFVRSSFVNGFAFDSRSYQITLY